jgi:hypothetical protein
MATLEQLLNEARDALNLSNGSLALIQLLRAWRGRRSQQLSEAIEQLSEQLSQGRFEPGGEGPEFHKAWLERESVLDPLDIGILLPGISSLPAVTLVVRVERLLARGGDPRVSMQLGRLIERVPTTAMSNYSLWKVVLDALSKEFRDPRVRSLVEKRLQTEVGGETFWGKFKPGLEPGWSMGTIWRKKGIFVGS